MELRRGWRADHNVIETERRTETEVLRKTTVSRRAEALTNGQANQWREKVWLPKTYTYTNSRMENFAGEVFSALLTKSKVSEIRLISDEDKL